MNQPTQAIGKLIWLESRLLLIALAALLFGFHWIHSWVASQFNANQVGQMIEALPELLRKLVPVEVHQAVKTQGRLTFAYDHPIMLLGCMAWAIARGSDSVSGQLGRGTLEMILAQPITRGRYLLMQAAVLMAGAVVLSWACWLGTVAGLFTVPALAGVSPVPYLWAAGNALGLMMFMGGVAALCSSWDRHRWRTIGFTAGIYVLALMFKVIGRAVPNFDWMLYLSFLTCYEPQKIVADPSGGLNVLLKYDGLLLGGGLLAYAMSFRVFAARDIPAPL